MGSKPAFRAHPDGPVLRVTQADPDRSIQYRWHCETKPLTEFEQVRRQDTKQGQECPADGRAVELSQRKSAEEFIVRCVEPKRGPPRANLSWPWNGAGMRRCWRGK